MYTNSGDISFPPSGDSNTRVNTLGGTPQEKLQTTRRVCSSHCLSAACLRRIRANLAWLSLGEPTIKQKSAATRVSAGRIAQVNTVLDDAPDLADAVLSGALPLNDAYEEARRRKEEAESDEAKFPRLQSTHPEIAVMVQEGQLAAAGALAEAAERRLQ